MSGPILAPDDVAAVKALASSPAAKAALQAEEDARAKRRADVLAKHREDLSAAAAAMEAAAKPVEALRAEVAKRRAALDSALLKLNQALSELDGAGAVADQARNRLPFDLAALGGGAIDRAVGRLGFELRRAAGGISHSQIMVANTDGHGVSLGETRCDTPQLVERVTVIQAMIADIESLRTADLRPDEVERRCAEAIRWADEGAQLDPNAGERSQGLGLFQRAWARLVGAVNV